MSNYLESVSYALKSSDLTDPRNSLILKDAFELSRDFKNGHTSYQLLMFVLNEKDNPTIDSKYQQALREIDARIEALKTNYYHIRKLENECKQLEVNRKLLSIETMSNKNTATQRELASLKQEEIEIEIEKRSMQLDTVRKDVARLMRELDVFVAFCKQTKDKLSVQPDQYVDSLIEEHKHFLLKLGLPELSIQSLCNTTTTPDSAADAVTARLIEAHGILKNRHIVCLPDESEESTKQIPLPSNVLEKERTNNIETNMNENSEDDGEKPNNIISLFKTN